MTLMPLSTAAWRADLRLQFGAGLTGERDRPSGAAMRGFARVPRSHVERAAGFNRREDGGVNVRHDRNVAQVRAAQVRAAQVRAAQVRAAQVRAAQVRAAQVRAAQVRAAQVRAAQVRAAQVRAAQVRVAQVRAAQVRAAQTLLPELQRGR
jgi:hypothetical protein